MLTFVVLLCCVNVWPSRDMLMFAGELYHLDDRTVAGVSMSQASCNMLMFVAKLEANTSKLQEFTSHSY